MLSEYIGVLLLLGLATAGVGAALLAGRWLTHSERVRAPARSGPGEAAGSRAEPSAEAETEPWRADFGESLPPLLASVGGPRFARAALLFVVFSAASTFFYPWAATFRETRLPGLVAVAVFMLPLAVVSIYAWRRGSEEP